MTISKNYGTALNLLYAFMNIDIAAHSSCDIDSAKARLATLKENRSLLFKEHKILKSQKNVNKFLSAICDKNAFEAKVSAIERLQFDIFELKKSRNSITSRRLKCGCPQKLDNLTWCKMPVKLT